MAACWLSSFCVTSVFKTKKKNHPSFHTARVPMPRRRRALACRATMAGHLRLDAAALSCRTLPQATARSLAYSSPAHRQTPRLPHARRLRVLWPLARAHSPSPVASLPALASPPSSEPATVMWHALRCLDDRGPARCRTKQRRTTRAFMYVARSLKRR